jgi:hypothetical protein
MAEKEEQKVVAKEGWTTAASVAASSEPRTETVKYQRMDEGRRGRKWARLETVFDSQLKAQHCGNFHSYSLLTHILYTWWLLLEAIWIMRLKFSPCYIRHLDAN